MTLYVVETHYHVTKPTTVEVLWEVEAPETEAQMAQIRRDIMHHATSYAGDGYTVYSLRRLNGAVPSRSIGAAVGRSRSARTFSPSTRRYANGTMQDKYLSRANKLKRHAKWHL